MSEFVAGLMIILKKYKRKIIQVYAPTSTYNDVEVERFCVDVEATILRILSVQSSEKKCRNDSTRKLCNRCSK